MTTLHNNPQGTAGSEQSARPPQQEYIIDGEYIDKLDEWLSEHGIDELQRMQIRTRLKLNPISHTSAQAPVGYTGEDVFGPFIHVHNARIDKAARDQVLSLMGDCLAEHIYTFRGISCDDSMKMAAYIGSLRHQQEAEQPKEERR